MAAKIGTLAINIVSNHAKAVAGMREVGRSSKGLSRDIHEAASSVKMFGLGLFTLEKGFSVLRKAWASMKELPEVKERFAKVNAEIQAMYQKLGTLLLPVMELVTKAASLLNTAWGKTAIAITGGVMAFAGFIYIVPKVVAAFLAINRAIRAVIASNVILKALSGPKGWAMLAAGMAVGLGAVYAITQALDGVAGAEREVQQNANAAGVAMGRAANQRIATEFERQADAVGRLAGNLARIRDVPDTGLVPKGMEFNPVTGERRVGLKGLSSRERAAIEGRFREAEGKGYDVNQPETREALLRDFWKRMEIIERKRDATAKEQLKEQAEQTKATKELVLKFDAMDKVMLEEGKL